MFPDGEVKIPSMKAEGTRFGKLNMVSRIKRPYDDAGLIDARQEQAMESCSRQSMRTTRAGRGMIQPSIDADDKGRQWNDTNPLIRVAGADNSSAEMQFISSAKVQLGIHQAKFAAPFPRSGTDMPL